MAASNKVPDNLNYLSNISFRLMIEDTPHLTWFCQSVNVPGVAIEAIEMVNPFANIPYAGSNVAFEELSITFIVDEHLKNWIEIYDRIIALGLGEGTEKYRLLISNPFCICSIRYPVPRYILEIGRGEGNTNVSGILCTPQYLVNSCKT